MANDPDEQEERARQRIGQVLSGKWTLERLLGMGGMAAVYAGRHRNGAKAAVKVLHPELARHKEIRERFLREGYAANRVEHPGAVAVLDDDVVQGGPDDGAAYIVMELLEGEPLESRAARKPLDERELLMVADGILEVLEAAHARGVVHRDLKPDNLFVLKSEDDALKIKVLDFGLARMVLPDEARAVTRHGVTIGTPAYMSPEQAAGRSDEIDGRADIFSLGAVMFRLRTGKRIHDAPHPIELVGKMAKLPAPNIRDVDPSVSPPFAAIVDRALSFRREDRYPDAASMRADVLAALGPKVEPYAAPDSRADLGSEPTERAYYEPSRAPEKSLVARSFPIFGLLFIGLLAAGAWVVLRDGANTQTSSPPPTVPSATAETEADSASETDGGSEASVDASVLELPVEPLGDADPDANADANADADDEDEEDEDAGADAAIEDAPEASVTVDAAAFQALKPTAPKPKKKTTTTTKPTGKKKKKTKKK
ncbi:MAG: serine/threonine-protein kinase [Polyangiales bacterium]